MKPGIVGVAIFVIAVLVVAGYALFGVFGTRGSTPATVPAAQSLTTLTGYLGGEKESFMADPKCVASWPAIPTILTHNSRKRGQSPWCEIGL